DPARYPRPVGTRAVDVVRDPEAVLRHARTDRQGDSGSEQDGREDEGKRAPSEHAYGHVRKITQRAATPSATKLAGAGPAHRPGPPADLALVHLGDVKGREVRVVGHLVPLIDGGVVGAEAIELVSIGVRADARRCPGERHTSSTVRSARRRSPKQKDGSHVTLPRS